MNTFETIALLLMCAAGIGIVYWMYRMIQSQMYTEILLNDTRDKVMSAKVMIASLRHDLSLDRQGMDDRFDGVHAAIVDTGDLMYTMVTEVITDEADITRQQVLRARMLTEFQQEIEHKKTRKDIQEVKTGDEWSKKRELEINEKLDELIKRKPVEITFSDPKPQKESNQSTVQPESATGVVNIINQTTKNRRRKKKPTASK